MGVDIFLHIVSSLIIGGIIDIDNMIVAIVLHEYRIEIPQIQPSINILIGWHHNTKTQLLTFVVTDFIVRFEVFGFCVDHVLDPFHFLCLVFIELCHVHLDLATILDVVCEL